jgi:hypothetical protein
VSDRTLQLAVVLGSSLALAGGDGGQPGGWYITGRFVSAYAFGTTRPGACGQPGGRVRRTEPQADGEVQVLQTFEAGAYRGARVRFTATLDARGIEGSAGLLLRAEGREGQALALDDMRHRPLKGTLRCGRISVVLDVPKETEQLSLGVTLAGGGSLEFSDVALEKVPDSVPLTAP